MNKCDELVSEVESISVTTPILNLFKKPDISNLHTFFKRHPNQPYENVEFNPMKAYFRTENNLTFQRKWISLCEIKREFFCTFCLAFGQEENRFTLGCSVLSSNNVYTAYAYKRA